MDFFEYSFSFLLSNIFLKLLKLKSFYEKIAFGLVLATLLVACKNNEEKVVTNEQASTDSIQHLYKPMYTDNWKIGDKKNVLLAEELYKYFIAKDFEGIGNLIADLDTVSNDDGTTIKGKAAILDLFKKIFSEISLKNFKVGVIFPVIGENRHQWVCIWDEVDVETADGRSQKIQ